jgi:HD-GYP domain-containing protein (c-di-GMP phosphodiesterase class II)
VKPFHRDRFALAVDRGRQWRKQALEELHWHAILSVELEDRAAQICAAIRGRTEGATESEALAAIAAERAPGLMIHAERVTRYAVAVGRELAIDAVTASALEIAARFHDIGKAAVPEALLTKPSPLTPGERAIMQRHVDIGARILASTVTLSAAAPFVLAAHEWFGGGGYPRKIAGIAIPLASRIIAVADAYDAMTQDRHYHSSLDSGDAVAELLRCCPAQFDSEVVGAFLAVLGRH